LYPNFILLCLGLFVIVSRLVFLTSSTNFWDSASYVEQVRACLAGEYSYMGLRHGHALYVWICAGLAEIVKHFGSEYDVLWSCKVAGILVNASSVFPLFWLARWLLRSETGALAAAGIFTVIPLTWWWSGEILSDSMGTDFLIWPFGLLALWMEKKYSAPLALACLFMGSSFLIRGSNVFLLPLFGLILIFNSWHQRRWLLAAWIVIIPLPALGGITWDMANSGRLFASYFEQSSETPFSVERLISPAWLRETGGFLSYSLGWAGLVVTGLGLITRGRAAVFTLAWSLPVVVSTAALPNNQIRFFLPLMPAAAILMAGGLAVFSRVRRGILVSTALGAALVCLMVLHALPDLQALHNRVNILDALPRWYQENTSPGAIIITEGEHNHVRIFTRDRTLLYYEIGLYRKPWLFDLVPVATPGLVWRVDEALEQGKEVYACTLLPPASENVLKLLYDSQRVGTVGGSHVRNTQDLGFSHLGENMRRIASVQIYRLVDKKAWPRSAPPPRVTLSSAGASWFVDFDIHCPAAAGRPCCGIVDSSAVVFDPTQREYGGIQMWKDAFERNGNGCRLDDEGRGQLRVSVAQSMKSMSAVLFAAFAVLNAEGIPILISEPKALMMPAFPLGSPMRRKSP